MKISTLTPREFFILSQFMNRGETRPSEIATAAEGQISLGSINSACRSMTKRNLIIRKRRVKVGGEWQSFYAITRHGQDAWTEFLDWTTCTAKGMTPSPEPPAPKRGRLPTADEQTRLLNAASVEFARFCRAVWAMPHVGIRELAEADAQDFDAEAGLLTVGVSNLPPKSRRRHRRRVALSDDAKAILREAVGLRRVSPLFVGTRGNRYRATSVGVLFRYLRKECGISSDVKIRETPYCGTRPKLRKDHRMRCRSSS